MTPSSKVLPLLFLGVRLLAASPAASGDGDEQGLKHIHLYVHETFTGPNATAFTVVPSPIGANSSFGQVQVFDDELRVGRDRASPLVGRFQGTAVGMGGTSFLTTISFVFTAGEHRGSTLSVEGPVLGFTGDIERAVVGGTGEFRMARGYSLMKVLGRPTPMTVLFEIHLFVHAPKRHY